ncbi:hypothetical protein [Enterococcus bulliens]|uniref:hypothetical protein n=1 Tax=uncultured Enterococcus sp. TaxID=167972 RepID=UPI0025E62653|nr:hypothetical protein [uncultured Enterococcus sp.]
MSAAQEVEQTINHLLHTLKASQSLKDQYGNKIASVKALGEQLIQIEFTHNQKPLVEHITQFKCFID